MDCHCLEAVLGLPACRVLAQGCGPPQRDVPLQRRDEPLVCRRCQACCSHVQESRPRCLRALPILEPPVILWLPMRRFQGADGHHRPWETRATFGARVPWTERLSHQARQACLRGCPCTELARRYGLSERTVQQQRDQAAAKDLKKLRKRWLQSADQLHVDELLARDEWRRRFPEWRATLDWVQDVRQWCERTYDKPAREAWCKLMARASQSAQESLQRVAGTLHRWFEPIVRSIRHRSTNGMTEGFNNKIKLIQRMAYGLRNAHKRRKRILAWCGQP